MQQVSYKTRANSLCAQRGALSPNGRFSIFDLQLQLENRKSKIENRNALTLVEMVMALAIMAILFAAFLPQFRSIRNSWDSKKGGAEALQGGRVLTEHLYRNLATAVRITTVSDSTETDGFIEFEDNDGNTLRYDVNGTTSYVEFGVVGDLAELAGPVSRLQFTCYDAYDFDTAINDCNYIRLVEVQTILTNSAALAQEKNFTVSAYLRTNVSSLVGWWKLDETSGLTAADSSGKGNDGTLTNMAGDEWTNGVRGGALDFDGGDDYIEVPDDPSFDIAEAITVAAWINPDDAGAWRTILSKFAHTPGWRKDLYWFLYDGKIGASLAGPCGSQGNDWRPNVPIQSGTWTHVALTYNGSTMIMYKNGANAASTSVSGALMLGDSSSNESFYIGTNTEWGEYFDGTIDDVLIYSSALTADEISQLAGLQCLTSWTTGLSHTAQAGSNRLLVFTAHAEDDNSDMNLTSVTYGGQSMTKVIERNVGSDYRAYVVAYILDEAGITAASDSDFTVTWAQTPYRTPEYSSVFLRNVDQDNPTGAGAANGGTSATLTTSALSTEDGDMVFVAGTCGNTGSYSVNNNFTEAVELTITSADGIAGYKKADGSDEIPSITHSDVNRQVIIGFVVNDDDSGGDRILP